MFDIWISNWFVIDLVKWSFRYYRHSWEFSHLTSKWPLTSLWPLSITQNVFFVHLIVATTYVLNIYNNKQVLLVTVDAGRKNTFPLPLKLSHFMILWGKWPCNRIFPTHKLCDYVQFGRGLYLQVENMFKLMVQITLVHIFRWWIH